MPITIRPSVVKIKKPSTGEYKEINALLDTDSAKTVYYGVSSTAADTQTKTVTIEGISALSDGLLVRILFANAQSYSGVPKLMINSTDASNIKTRRGTDATDLTWKAGDVLDFVYDSSSSGFIVLDKGDIKDLNGAVSDLNGAVSDLNGAIKYILTSTGDTTDRYSDIMYCLNNYGACVLGDGVFYINSTLGMPDNTTLSGIGVNTVLQLADNSSGQVAVNVGSYCLVKDMTIKGSSTELQYSSYTRGNRKAVSLLGDYTGFESGTTSHNFAKLSNLTITDFNHSGIWATKNDGTASFLAENIDILRCHTGINIELFSEFHSFTNIRCRNCNIACVMQGGNNIFTNCHFDVNLSNMECDDSQGTLVNAAHSSFVGCTFTHPNNNTGYNVWIKGTANGWIFSDCQFWYGIIRLEDASGIILTNNIIGGTNNIVIIARCTSVNFCNNIFKTQVPTLNLGSTTGLTWENNRNPDGSLNIVADNGQISTQVYTNIYSADTANSFDSYETTYVSALTTTKNTNNVSMYLRLKSGTPNGQLVGTLKSYLRPYTDWAMLGLYANTASSGECYTPVGSVWIKTDGKVYVYKNATIAANDVYYCFGSYIAYKSS